MFLSNRGYHRDNLELSKGGPKKTSFDGRTVNNYHYHNINNNNNNNHHHLMFDFPLHLAREIFSEISDRGDFHPYCSCLSTHLHCYV